MSGPTPSTASIDHHLQVLRDSLEVQVPYTGGIYAVKPEDLVVYYDVEGDKYPRRLDLGNATEEDLVAVASACDQATFGVDEKDVLDESYRKAGKMDLTKFASRFDVVASGLVDAISPDILQGQGADGDKTLRAELYKLNVYGPGSFFKGHKDTPRGETMIGSLVVVFPTAHNGGALSLEHGGTTWTFDSVAELAAARGPALAYVAFYSDVTHAVQTVHSGHRVTLTYNLFLLDHTARRAPANRIIPAPEQTLEASLRALLADPLFMPQGGLLAYGLAHQYPMPAPPEVQYVEGRPQVPPSRLGPILNMLKGGDARVRTVSERVGLPTRVKILYDSGATRFYAPGKDVLTDDVLNTADVDESHERGTVTDAIERRGTVIPRSEERGRALKRERPMYCDDEEEAAYAQAEVEAATVTTIAVQWVTQITEGNRVGSHFLAYGNQASLGQVYGNAALFVEVPAAGEGVRA
ncbi:hypothetical protein C8R46DRAFT_1272968 [Mycena filopes]|nr:hypothetical protein C8R46DRAFT_1272968 [Mycena filopes]